MSDFRLTQIPAPGTSHVKFCGDTFIFSLALCFSVAPMATAASDEEEVLQVELNFIKAYMAKDFKQISSLYLHSSKTSTFNPGGQSLLFKGWDESLKERWKGDFASQTNDVEISFLHPQVTMITDDVAVLTGYESVISTNPTTKEATTSHNRLTRVVQRIKGKWLIVHDHVTTFTIE